MPSISSWRPRAFGVGLGVSGLGLGVARLATRVQLSGFKAEGFMGYRRLWRGVVLETV